MKNLTWIMDVGGVRGPRASLCPGLSLSVTLGKLQPSLAWHCPVVTSQSERLWLCHELNWHLFPGGVYNLLDDNRRTTISQLENPCAESPHGKGTWSDLRRGERQGKNILPWYLQWEFWKILISSVDFFFSCFNILEIQFYQQAT